MAKKKKVTPSSPPPEPKYVYVTYHESKSGGEVREGYEDSDWPEYEDEYVEWYLTGCFKDKDAAPWQREPIAVDFAPEVGQEVWVTWVNYNTGCTFGRTLGVCTILGVYSTQEEAEAVKKSVYDDTFPGYKSWVGYFESFNSCEIGSLVVK